MTANTQPSTKEILHNVTLFPIPHVTIPLGFLCQIGVIPSRNTITLILYGVGFGSIIAAIIYIKYQHKQPD